jgi:ERCC4-type nuclease
MLLVDSRAGSKELVAPLQALGVPVCETTLDFGDVAFVGRGEGGAPIDIGVEFKKTEELIQSLRSGRLVGHQLIGMRQAYDFCWLVVEGDWRADAKTGLVAMKGRKGWAPIRGSMSAGELEKQLLTLQLKGGLNVRFTSSRSDTLRVLVNLYRWFSDTDMDKHRSHLAIYHPAPLTPISDFRQIVSGIPGVGFRASLAAEKAFKTVRRAMSATVAEWAELSTIDDKGKTKRLGEKVADRIDRILG